jgi:hypothetical protein
MRAGDDQVTKTRLKQTLQIFIIAVLIFTLLPAGTGQAQSNYSPFHDVPTSHWALPYIIKSELMGVVAGYGNNLFKPDQTVTQLEAVIMAVRAMGLEKETDNTNNYVDTSKYDLPTTWNAKGYVSVAIKEGLIIESENTFKPNSGASRAWSAQLLIRMLNMENELNLTARTAFNDDAQIPVWAKRYVALAADRDIISGISNSTGGYDYQPNNAVTRAQFATLISRSDRYMNDAAGQLPIGVIEKIEASQVTIVKTNKTKNTYTLTNTTSMYDQKYASINQAQFKAEDAVRFYADSAGNLKYIEKVNSAHYTNLPTIEKADVLKGSLIQIYSDQNVIVVKRENNALFTGFIADDVQIKDVVQNRNITIDDLYIGDELELTLTGNTVTKITLVKSSQEAILKGTIFAIDTEKGLLTLDNNGRYASYLIDDSVSVVYEGIRFATVRDLQKGDQVELQMESDRITKVTLIKPYQATDYQGNIVAISVVDRIITILTTESTPIAYRVTDKTEYKIPTVVNPTLADLEVGDQVKFTVDNTDIKNIEVLNRNIHDAIKGQIININTTNKLITIETTSKELRTYKYDDTMEIYIDDNSNGKFSDLSEGITISLTIDNTTIRRITITNTIEGEVESYDKDRNTITIKHDNGSSTFTLNSSLDIQMHDILRPKLDDLKRGMKIVAHLKQNRVSIIEVKKTIASFITSVDTGWNRIEIIDPDNSDKKLRYYVYSSADIIVPGVDHPDLTDIRKNDAIEINFVGFDLETISVLPAYYGVVTAINTSGNRIEVRNRYENNIVTVNNDLTILSTSGVHISPTSLRVNDFVKVINIGDKTRVYQTYTTEVEYYSVLNDRIYYYDSSRAYRDMVMDKTVQVWQGNNYLLPGDLARGSKITLYQMDGIVIGIRAN